MIRTPRVTPSELIHPNEKPEGLISYLIEHLTVERELILDPFSGSGIVALIAARLKRKYLGIELDRHYVELSKARIREEVLFREI